MLTLETNLADILAAQGKYEEADPLFADVIVGWREAGNLFQLSTALNNYGKSLYLRNRYQESLEPLRRAVELRRQETGANNTRLATSLNNLAAALEKIGRLEEAADAFTEAIAITRNRYPEGHTDLLLPLNNLALLRYQLGQPELAIALMGDAVDIAANIGNYYTEWIRHNLAKLEIATDPGKAEATVREAIRRQDYQEGDAWRRQSMRSVLGSALAAQGRFREAEDLLTSSYAAMIEAPGVGHPSTQEARQRLVELYEAWDKPERAADYRSDEAGDADAGA